MQAAKEAKTKEDVAAQHRKFFCVDCNKGYTVAVEFERHMSSYDHHHVVVRRRCSCRAPPASPNPTEPGPAWPAR